MAPTKPIVPVDETPIDQATLARILASAPEELILVGGQALAFWMMRFGIGPRPDEQDLWLAGISTDADFLGPIEPALKMARALKVKLTRPGQSALTSLVGQIRIKAPNGLDYNIDVLHQIYSLGGIRKSVEFTRRVQARASKIELDGGGVLTVLHPLDVLDSRIQNAAGLLEQKGPHVLTQAKWAIRVAKRALEQLVNSSGEFADRPGALAAEIYRLASSRAGRLVQSTHGIEVAEAIPFALLIERVPGFEKQARKMVDSLHQKGQMQHLAI